MEVAAVFATAAEPFFFGVVPLAFLIITEPRMIGGCQGGAKRFWKTADAIHDPSQIETVGVKKSEIKDLRRFTVKGQEVEFGGIGGIAGVFG